jgi:hypothetical protein
MSRRTPAVKTPPVAKPYKPLSKITTEVHAVKPEAQRRLRHLILTINKASVEAHAIAKMLEK